MEEKGLGENQLSRDLSKGVILDKYVIEFLNNYKSSFEQTVDIIMNSNQFVKELEDILFLLDSNEIGLMSVTDNLYRLRHTLRLEYDRLKSDWDFDNKDSKKLIAKAPSYLRRVDELEYELEDKLHDLIRSDSEKNKRKIEMDIRRIISKVLDAITNYQNNQIKEIDAIVQIINENYSNTDANKRNQVFLSHAFKDRLYTLGLFLHFYEQNVYLYIDWMHQSKNSKTKKLKNNLIREIRNSDQLLFLRTLNSELALQGGNRQIRQWCAWEIGTFDYKTRGKEDSRFYIDRFRKNRQSKSQSQIIQDFQPLRGIQNGRLY
ncbi:hypothetical protein [uncultured Streptococcus sp.]|jgi:hypothetical protein|uniref:hypothetical protein n=1 Tax=uncultured Streptococcus sp. TaxID=83427 RepID=UPI002676C6D5|nr:hypothetical protein [uncultured Streptococcus sp.]